MITYDEILKGAPISVIGLGYVGLPVAVAFARKVKVIGFDVNSEKVGMYLAGQDPTGEVCLDELKKTTVKFTSDAADLKAARLHVVAVPTPINADKTPDLSMVKSACELLGKNLSAGSVVVFESTVYPGVTEDICVPELEKHSGLVCGRDFKVGYSPERISPGDKVYKLETIIKVVAGMDDETTQLLAQVYELVVEAGVYKASSIKVAEAAKVIENSQRDLNIAFANEISVIFHMLGIDTLEVLKAAGTKWNFLNFRPGLVGGHCIGVDPYYLTYCAQKMGYHPQILLAGRRINDDMGRYVAENAVKQLSRRGVDICRAKVAVFGFTFKEDCPDTRNTRVIDIVTELNEYGIRPQIHDPVAHAAEATDYYDIELVSLDDIAPVDCAIVAVSHREFQGLKLDRILKQGGLLFDVKGMFDPDSVKQAGYGYWRL